MPRFIDSANPGYVKARNELLTQKGFDPSKYDIDFDSGRIVERDQFSALGAAGTAAAYNAPEAIVGSGAAALASLLPAPPIIKIPAMIGSALLAPMLASPATSALKEAVVPGAGAAFTQARREHPWASAIGGQAAALAGGMRPSISTPVEAARGLRSLIAGVPVARLPASQGGALLNTGIGVGLGAGIPLARGEPLSEIAAGAAGGLAFTEPSWLGRKVFGFSPTPAASAGYAPPSKPVAPAAQKPVQDYSAFDTGEYQHSESDFIGYEPDERSYWEYSGGDYEQPFIDAEAKRRKDDFFLARAEQRRQIDAELATPKNVASSQKNEPVERTQLSQNQGLPYRQLGPQNTDIPVRRGFFASETDKLRQAGPVHGELADAFERLYANRRAMQGRYANPMIHAASKLNPAQRKQLYDTLLTENQTGREQLLNITDPEVRQAYGVYRDVLELMSRDRIKAGQPVMLSDGTTREHRSNPYYMFNTVSSDARRILNEGQGTPAFEALKNDFIQHQIQSGDGRITEDEAVRRFNNLLGSFHESPASNPASFKGVRLPEGYGLPDSWIEKDLVKATRQYVNMYTRDRAFWDTIETNPRLMKMLGSASYRGSEQIPPEVQAELANYNLAHDKQVQNIKAHYLGSSITGQEPIISSLGRLVNSAILGGPVTKLTDMFTVPVKALAYTPVGNIGAIVKGIAEWRKGIDDSFATGFNRRGGLIVAQDILGIGEYTASMLDKVAEGITKWTGSEALELASRGLSQSIGTFIGDSQRALARAGNREAVEFLSKLGSDWDSLSREELGTRIGQLFQGRYNITNLPRWALDSPVAPFVGMMKWSIEQANNFRKFVIAPALRGNLAPAAMTLIGGLGGGLVLNELRQMIGGSPSQVPTWKEIEQADDKTEAVAYKLISAAQVTGTAGIFSEMLKQVYESMSGRLPQGFRYPLLSVAGDITQRFTSAAKAIADGEDIGLVTAALMRDIMKTHVQILRTLHNQLGQLGVGEIAPGVDPAKAVTQQRQRRDLRMFERLRGYQQGSVVRTAPDYSKLSEQRFDEADPSEAAAMLPSLLSRYAQQSRTPGQMAGRLRQLGAGSTSSIVPSPNTDPQRFGEYLQFIERTQGPDAVRRLVAEYHRRQAESSIKKSMIPKL